MHCTAHISYHRMECIAHKAGRPKAGYLTSSDPNKRVMVAIPRSTSAVDILHQFVLQDQVGPFCERREKMMNSSEATVSLQK
mmetsp:Transcript_34940/g.58514  ORF Transcript_34940/g.58514 Transcript_34940/m.58514 type:complete len:82 (-) Transcript_34940:2-247(-)